MEDSRGQIILVAALAIAVTFVALALIVNTVIFTENLATRETVSGKEAALFQQNVIDSGGELLERANAYNNSSYDDLSSTFRLDIEVLSESENQHAVTNGGLREIAVVTVNNGTRIEQTTAQPVNDTSDKSNWVMSNDVSYTEDFVMNFSSYSSDFRLNVTDGPDWWAMEVNSSGVTTYNNAGTIGTCAVANPTSVDLTNGSVDGSACSSFQFAEGVSTPYDISIENGNQVDATYLLIVDRELDSAMINSTYDGSNSEPTAERLIYNSTLYLEFQRSDLTYSSNVTVEPAS